MGFWGTFVLCRPDGDLDEVAAIVSRDESVEEADRPGGGRWRVGRCDDEALFRDADAVLDELVDETGAPALLGYVLDSDCVELVAYGTTSGRWRSCLERASLAIYAGDEPLDDAILLPEPAAERAAQWAVEAGMTPDIAALRTVFLHGSEQIEDEDEDEDDFVFAEELFDQLVVALGTPHAKDTPAPATPRKRSPRSSRPKHPLDAFVEDYAVDLLEAAGYTKHGRTFRRSNASGDSASITFQPFHLGNLLDFQAGYGIATMPYAEVVSRRIGRPVPESPGEGFDMWRDGVDRPHRGATGSTDPNWPVTEFDRDERGRDLQDALTQQVLPMLTTLLDRPNLVDVVRDYHLTDGILNARDAEAAALLLAEAGPSVLLDRALGECDDATVVDYVRRQLAEQGYPEDGWRDTVGDSGTDPVVRARDLLTGVVDDVMARGGYHRTDLRYFRQSTAGDYAVVEISPQSYVGTDVRFRLSSAVVPAGEVDRSAVGRDPAARLAAVTTRNGWLPEWVRPPAAHAAVPDAATDLDAGLWTFTDATSDDCARALADAVTNVAPRFTQLLDRTWLAAHVMDPVSRAYVGGYAHAADVLGLDLADWHPELLNSPFGPR